MGTLEKYVNPFTDFGFKKIFTEDDSKPCLIDFLNSLLPPENKIKLLNIKYPELLGRSPMDRKAILDLYCENEKGEKFIIELQRSIQDYFKERAVYYSTFPIQKQAKKGRWKFKFKAVFCIGILDFTFDDYEDEQEKKEVMHIVKLKDQQGRVFYDKLTYIYLQLPNFKKRESQLENRLDKWLYFFKNLPDLLEVPKTFRKDLPFDAAFEKAALANLTPEQYDYYQADLKNTGDWYRIRSYADRKARKKGMEIGKKKGIKEGMEQGMKEGVEQGKKEGMKEGREMAKAEAFAETFERILATAAGLKNNGISLINIANVMGIAPEVLAEL